MKVLLLSVLLVGCIEESIMIYPKGDLTVGTNVVINDYSEYHSCTGYIHGINVPMYVRPSQCDSQCQREAIYSVGNLVCNDREIPGSARVKERLLKVIKHEDTINFIIPVDAVENCVSGCQKDSKELGTDFARCIKIVCKPLVK